MEDNKEDKVNQSLCDKLFDDMIGNNVQFESPIEDEKGNFTKKFIIYNDFTASGKGLKSVESFIQNQVLPTYANVHSTVGHNAEITSKYFLESKEILRKYTNAHGTYSIIFHGQGATGGVSKLIEVLSIKKYVMFYDYLKTAFELKGEYGDKIVERLKDGLIKKIKDLFTELFKNINFCYKVKDKDNSTYKIKCFLCRVELENEGDYNKHITEEEHKNFLEEYEENPSRGLFKIHGEKIKDFIDIIRMNYNVSSNESILRLINDYKKFKPVVFYSLYEHNSNSLSWKETQCEIIVIGGEYKKFYNTLKAKLEEYKDNYIKIGSFTASSNITGLLLDVDKIAALMHQANGFAFFDYAAAAPYLKIDVNHPLPDDYRKKLGFDPLSPEEKIKVFKDGMFFSPHKFIGGPNTPGVLITHDRIYRNQLKPTQPGGGTVNFVYKDMIDYIHDVEYKEESGTPNIIGSIRLGLMISIRQKIPHDFIIKKDEEYIKLFREGLSLDETDPNKKIHNLYILHDDFLRDKTHIPVFSFMISFGDKFLHPNYICALLNDFFGIQSRPGCSCAPNYGRYLLGFDKDNDKMKKLQSMVSSGNDIFKPGYLRLNLPYFYPEYVIKYVIEAIKFICENGHLFLGLYYYDIKSGKFYHYLNKNKDFNLSLNLFDFSSNLPRNEDLYANKNKKILTEKELKNIFNQVKSFTNENFTYLKRTFYLQNNYPYTRRHDHQKFNDEQDEARWFCIYRDVKELLRMLNMCVISKFSQNNKETYLQLENEFEQKTRIKKRDWDIKYQREFSLTMVEG